MYHDENKKLLTRENYDNHCKILVGRIAGWFKYGGKISQGHMMTYKRLLVYNVVTLLNYVWIIHIISEWRMKHNHIIIYQIVPHII